MFTPQGTGRLTAYLGRLRKTCSKKYVSLSFVALLGLLATHISANAGEAANTSVLHQRINAGRYRIVQLAAAPSTKSQTDRDVEEDQRVIATLQATDTNPGAVYHLALPQDVTQRFQLRADSAILIKHRVYGLLFSIEEKGNTPFYILLDPEWENTNAWKRVE